MTAAGTYIKRIRTNKCLSQRQLAALSGVHQNTILAFENGKRSPSVDNTIKLLDALGYEVILRQKADK